MSPTLLVAPDSQVTIEKATWRDLNALRHIERLCFPKDAWPLWDLIGVLSLPNVVRLKAIVMGEIVGFIAGDIRPSQRMAWIATIAVLPDYRRQGIGAALLEACEKQLTVPNIQLSVRASNQAAINLYQSFGYQQTDMWPAYYQGGEDALVMTKKRYDNL